MAKAYPETLLDFEHWFRTEEACRAYVAKLRWSKGFMCPRCGHRQAWETGRGLRHCAACHHDVSATAGTIFHGSHLPLRLWFRMMWMVTNQKSGVSALGLQRALGLSGYLTAWACLQKLRRAMVRPERELLSGKVEVDETILGGVQRGGGKLYFGKRKFLVGIAAEIRGEGIGRIRLEHIRDTSAKTLEGFVKRTIAPGSTVVTDGRWSYGGLEDMGYVFEPIVLTGKGKMAPIIFLPRVHRIASLLKRWLLGIHQGRISGKHLGYYLDEYTFRFNRRLSAHRGMLFYRLLQQAVAIPPTTHKSLFGQTYAFSVE